METTCVYSVSCNQPPPNQCLSTANGIVYDENGVCLDGTCVYSSITNECNSDEGCEAGVCSACTVSYPNWLGDGYCDSSAYNSGACGWDGGTAALRPVKDPALQRQQKVASTLFAAENNSSEP